MSAKHIESYHGIVEHLRRTASWHEEEDRDATASLLRESATRIETLERSVADLRAALGGAMFFVPLGTEARKRGDAAMDASLRLERAP